MLCSTGPSGFWYPQYCTMLCCSEKIDEIVGDWNPAKIDQTELIVHCQPVSISTTSSKHVSKKILMQTDLQILFYFIVFIVFCFCKSEHLEKAPSLCACRIYITASKCSYIQSPKKKYFHILQTNKWKHSVFRFALTNKQPALLTNLIDACHHFEVWTPGWGLWYHSYKFTCITL